MVPQKIVAGDSLSFSIESFYDPQGRSISAVDWALKISIRGNGASLDSTAAASGSGWLFTLLAANTTGLPAGKSFYQIYATKGLEKITVFGGNIQIAQNLVGASGAIDNRSQNQKDLESVQALIRQIIANGGPVEYRIGNRQLKRYEMVDLLTLESRLKYQVALENKADSINSGLGNPHNLKVRF